MFYFSRYFSSLWVLTNKVIHCDRFELLVIKLFVMKDLSIICCYCWTYLILTEHIKTSINTNNIQCPNKKKKRCTRCASSYNLWLINTVYTIWFVLHFVWCWYAHSILNVLLVAFMPLKMMRTHFLFHRVSIPLSMCVCAYSSDFTKFDCDRNFNKALASSLVKFLSYFLCLVLFYFIFWCVQAIFKLKNFELNKMMPMWISISWPKAAAHGERPFFSMDFFPFLCNNGKRKKSDKQIETI